MKILKNQFYFYVSEIYNEYGTNFCHVTILVKTDDAFKPVQVIDIKFQEYTNSIDNVIFIAPRVRIDHQLFGSSYDNAEEQLFFKIRKDLAREASKLDIFAISDNALTQFITLIKSKYNATRLPSQEEYRAQYMRMRESEK